MTTEICLPATAMSGHFGPAMRKLSSREQLFVCLLFEGAKNATEALERTGAVYKNRPTLRAAAHNMLVKSSVHDAIIEEGKRRTVELLPLAHSVIEEVARNPLAPASDRLKAAKMIRDDAGVTRISERLVNVKVEVSDVEKIARIKAFCVSRGIDPIKFLGFDPDVTQPVEAEYEEVSD